jgi:hypothetical protein
MAKTHDISQRQERTLHERGKCRDVWKRALRESVGYWEPLLGPGGPRGRPAQSAVKVQIWLHVGHALPRTFDAHETRRVLE